MMSSMQGDKKQPRLAGQTQQSYTIFCLNGIYVKSVPVGA